MTKQQFERLRYLQEEYRRMHLKRDYFGASLLRKKILEVLRNVC